MPQRLSRNAYVELKRTACMALAAGSVEVPLLKSLVAEQYGVKSINSNQLTIAEGVLKRGSIYEFACVVNEVGPGRHCSWSPRHRNETHFNPPSIESIGIL